VMVRTPFKAPHKAALVFKIETDGWHRMQLRDEAEQMGPITVDG
jgi:hypothetical protein